MTDAAELRTLDVTDTLARALAGHGVEVRRDGELLLLPRGIRGRATVFFIADGVVQLDVLLELWPGTVVHESCAGFGATEAAQIEDAWRIFTACSLHVLLSAFLYLDVGDEVTQTAWEIDGTVRAITIGGVVSRGPLDTHDWALAVRDLVERSTLPTGTHWIRAFAAIDGTEVIANEVVLDNQTWEWGQDELAAFVWPPTEHRASARLFLVVQGGVDVGRAIADLITCVDLDDPEIEERMVARGVASDDAAMLVALVPLAFGRRLLAAADLPLTVADEAVIVDGPDRREHVFRLADHPIFAEAAWLAEEGTYSKDQFLAVARRSAEVHLAEQLLADGRDLSTLGVAPIRIERPPPPPRADPPDAATP